MQQNRLFRKFLTTFVFLVLLPFMIVLGLLLYRTNRLQLQNDISQNETLTVQTLNSIHQHTELAENICKSVLQNQTLVNFLDREYRSVPDLLYYRSTIHDFVKEKNSMSDIKLQIYTSNNDIPLGFGVFFPMDSIHKTSSFELFCDSAAESIWLCEQPTDEYTQTIYSEQETYYHYLHKIQLGPHLIGIVDAMVPKRIFTVTDSGSGKTLAPTELQNCYIYNYSGLPLSQEQAATLAAAGCSGHDHNLIYSFKEDPLGPFNVLVITGRSQLTALNITLTLLIPALFIILMAGFFQYNRHAIQDIHICLDGMETAIANNFEFPENQGDAPVHQLLQRNDEISILANRINYLMRQIRTLLDQKIQQQTAAKEAQLLALQHQINPHFLYNTMEVFSARMELAGLYEESGAISAFCRMLRYNMNTEEFMTTIEDEIRQVKYYLAIQKIRNIPFEIRYDIPEELLAERTIRFLLEPFIENSFKYRGTAKPLKISISAREVDSGIELSIRNNGEVLSEERVQQLNERFECASASMQTNGEHIGLNNINSRLKLFYGEDHFIRVECDGQFTTFRFVIDRAAHLSAHFQ